MFGMRPGDPVSPLHHDDGVSEKILDAEIQVFLHAREPVGIEMKDDP